MTPAARGPGRARRAALGGFALVWVAIFLALGVWQVERRAWKHALIAAVDARIHAAPVAAPGPADWPAITAERDAYRRVRANGRFIAGRDTLVQAVTERGGGYWVLTPLDTGGFVLLVNRGFVAQDAASRIAPPPAGTVGVTGLLRVTEPGGAFLRHNDPAAGRWYSRDVAAISGARGLGRAAPYFIDADRGIEGPGQPIGGLTVVRFADNHLIYALTWFALAGLCGWAAWRALRRDAPA